jgi:Cu(I)/Ag(I) efflux system protein CusF
MKQLLFILTLAAATWAAAQSALFDGEVRKVDVDAKKITIRHGPLPELDMPSPMTMVYQVKDPAMVDKVKAGDKVKFAAEKVRGTFVLTRIERAR